MTTHTLRFLFALAALAASSVATAQFCQPGRQYVRSVGDVATDAACTHDTLQAAIDSATCPGTTIYVTREHLYTQQRLTITNRSITLVGLGDGIRCPGDQPTSCLALPCGTVPTTPQVTIDGSGTGRVVTITGNSHVGLRYLEIRGGSVGPDGSGGGIAFDGAGSLTLATTTVRANYAGYGGGINVRGTGAGATLRLEPETLILSNVAQYSGGGIRLEGATRLFALAPRTFIAFNEALGVSPGGAASGGFGGGIEVIGPARADLGSPGYNGAGVVFSNTAAYGGGISVNGSSDGEHSAVLRMFTTVADTPTHVSNNFASVRGGGLYLDTTDIGAHAQACVLDARIDDNAAADGAAVFLDWEDGILGNYGSALFFNVEDPAYGAPCSGPESPLTLGAVACAADAPCNSISGNVASDANGVATEGGTIVVGQGSAFFGERLELRGNRGGSVLRAGIGEAVYDRVALNNVLAVGNETTNDLIRAIDRTRLDLTGFTIAENAIGASVFYADGVDRYGLFNGIVDQPAVDTLAYSGSPANLVVRHVLSNDIATLPQSESVHQGRPRFAGSGDYRLHPSSPGIDFAPALQGSDLARRPRSVDLSGYANVAGPVDLGAYELQSAPADALFANGYE